MKSKTIKLFLFTFLMCLSSLGMWGQSYYNQTLYTQDFEDSNTFNIGWNVKSGSVAQVEVNGNMVIDLIQGGGSGDRAVTGNLSAMSSDFATVTDYSFEFDMGIATSNTNVSTLSLNSLNGVLFTINNPSYSTTSTIVAADGITVLATITHDGYIKACPKIFNHFKIESNEISGTFLTITNAAGNVVLEKTKISDGLSVLTTFSGSLGRAQPHFAFDNLTLKQHIDYAADPRIEFVKVDGKNRVYSIFYNEGETLYYKFSESDEYIPVNQDSPLNISFSTSGILYAYTTLGSSVSNVVEAVVEAGTEIILPEIKFNITNVIEDNGGEYKFTFGASCDNSEVLLKPEIKITADLNGVDVSDAIVAGTFIPENSGTLTINASADGYVGSSYSTFVASRYTCWSSLDFSTLNADNVAETLGEGWAFYDTNERWSSWSKDRSYSHLRYKTNGGTRITVNDRLRTRDVIQVNVGYGLGRNINEKIAILNVTQNEITEFKLYNGYGRPVADATYLLYVISNGDEIAVTTNSGCLLVQTKVYSPLVDYTINYVYDGNVVYTETGRAKKGTVITATNIITIDELNKYKVISEDLPAMSIIDGENVMNVPVRFAGHKQYTNVIYERGTNEETKWTEENLSDFNGTTLSLSEYGASYITKANSSDKSTRIISPTPGSTINIDAYWYGMSNDATYIDGKHGAYFRFGNVYIAQNDASYTHGYGFDGVVNMDNCVRFKGSNTYRSYDIATKKFLHIEMQINTATNMLIYLRVSEEGSNEYLVNVENKQLYDTDYTTLEWGFQKGKKTEKERKNYLKSIKITETANVLYERGVYTKWTDADLGNDAWKITVSNNDYPARTSIDETLGLSLLGQVRNQEITYTMPYAPSENSIISVEAQWYVGGTTGRAGNRTYFAIGNQIEFSAMPQDQKGYVTINGQEYKVTNACLDGYNNRTNDTWTIKARINILTNFVESLSIRGLNGTKTAQLDLTNIPLSSDAVYNTLKLGCERHGGSMYTSLKSIIITEEPVLFKYAKDKCIITSAGIGTLCSHYNLDFTNVENIAAYKAETSDGRINLTRVYEVAAREGVLIRSLNGGAVTEEIPVAATAYEPNEGNEFIGTLVDIESQPSEDAEYKYYILSSKTVNDAKVYGFYLANNKKIGAGKAYLRVPLAAAAKYSFFSFDDETTGVEDIELGFTETDSPVYDLFGRKVVNPATGLYIKNGKKFIVK